MRRLTRYALSLTAGLLMTGAANADSAALYAQVGRGGMPTPPSINDPSFQAAVLAAHNSERRLVGVRDIEWWPPLAQEAQAWASYIASRNVMQHQNQTAHGENIWINRAGMRSVGSMIAGWAIEKSIYIVGGRHPNVSRTGNWHQVGHYTQMVWSRTTHVGCAIARANGRDFLVCRYAPLGNFRGQMAFDPKGIPAADVVPAKVAVVTAPPPTPAKRVVTEPPKVAMVHPRPAPKPAKVPGPAVVPVAAPPPAPQPIPVVIPVVSTGNPVPLPAAKPTVVTAQAAVVPEALQN